MEQVPHAGVGGPAPRQARRSPLTWLLLAGLVGILLVLVAFGASGGFGSSSPPQLVRPDRGAAPAPQTTPAPTPTPTPSPKEEGKHKHDHGDQTPPPPDEGG